MSVPETIDARRVQLFTIGFTQKSAERFFTSLAAAGVKRIVDVWLHNSSQLAAFAKRDDLVYFLRAIAGIEYIHLPELAPTDEMLADYKKRKEAWDVYARRFLDLMAERRIEETVPRDVLDGGCLLCSEHKPHQCHRRLVAEYLAERWPAVTTQHLL